jgi:hypothetical protein
VAIETRQSNIETQQRVLSDVHNRTGRWFVQIGAIDTSDASTAASVLPVLSEWVSFVEEENIRAAIYSRFLTRHANRFIDQMLRWARQETYDLARGALIQGVARAVRPKDGARIWRELKTGRISDSDMMLLAKLSTFPSVAGEVKEYLVCELAANHWDVGDLQYIAKVEDPRIVAWFGKQTDSPDRAIRTLARRVTQKHRRLPPGISYSSAGPDRLQELHSAEVDVADIDQILEQWKSKFGADVPASVRSESPIWNCAEVDRWMSLEVDLKRDTDLKSAGTAKLWFRLEDVDVVEVVLTPLNAGHAVSLEDV